jgi:hypothetical protein
MSQHSEDRLLAPVDAPAPSARILPFERPQSELQKAVQLRAQQAMDLKRSRETRRAPLARWLIGITIALIPVLVLLGGLDGFLRVFHRINAAYATMPTSTPPPAATEPEQTEPGLVMLRPMENVEKAATGAAAPAVPAREK